MAMPAFAAAPLKQDFAYGIPLQVETGATHYELLLPDAVYRDIQRDDLGDLRVFNAAGEVVQHQFCPIESMLKTVVRRETLKVFPLPPGVPPRQALGAQLSVKTDKGTQITVIDSGAANRYSTELPPSAPMVQSFVLDVREIAFPLQGLQLGWAVEDGRAEVALRIEASDDLDQWRDVVTRTTVLRSEAEGQTLERSLVPLPVQRYKFLRVRPLDSDVLLKLNSVQAEVLQGSSRDEPVAWFDAQPDPLPPKAANTWYFSSKHRAPVQQLRVQLPDDNMAVQLSVSSRADASGDWRPRGQGESYVLLEGGQRHLSAPIGLSASHDRLWRLQLMAGAESLGTREPGLSLGYVPTRLRFLAQGSGPYLLAYGSARVGPSPQMGCARSPVSGTEPPAPALAGSVESLGGGQAPALLESLSPRLIVLWGALGIGVVLIVVMALNLLRRLKEPE